MSRLGHNQHSKFRRRNFGGLKMRLQHLLLSGLIFVSACEPYGFEHYKWYIPFNYADVNLAYGAEIDPNDLKNFKAPPIYATTRPPTEEEWLAFKRDYDLFPERLYACVKVHDPEHLQNAEKNPRRYAKWRGTYGPQVMQAVVQCMSEWGYQAQSQNLGMHRIHWFGPLFTPDD